MNKAFAFFIFVVLFMSGVVYSLPDKGRCKSFMNHAFQGIRSFQTKRRLRVAENSHWKKGARILKRMLKNNPEPSLQIEIARIAGKVEPHKGLDILQELVIQDPLPDELQRVIAYSIVFNKHPIMHYYWDEGKTKGRVIRFLKAWLEHQKLSFEVQNLFVLAALHISEREGFDLLKQISNQYPSLNVEREFGIIASRTGDSEMFKERMEAKDLSPEEREVYAFYAGQIQGSDGLGILKLLKEKATSTDEREQLKFGFFSRQD